MHPFMAFAAQMFPSSKENTNYARLCRLLVDVGSQVLKEIFNKICPPGGLDIVLASPSVYATLQSLRDKKILNSLQWSKLYPAIKSSVTSENFDITLLMVLLRNICGLTPPATGWDNLPSPTDLSCEADIARIKFYRNTVYAHATQASIDDVTFDDHWKNIRDTLVRLGGKTYEAAIDGLKHDCLDPDMKEEMNKSNSRSELPEKEPNIYGRTKEIEVIVQALLGKRDETVACVLISGTAGVGKSTVAIQAGYWLKNEFEAIVKFCSLRGACKGANDGPDSVVREILNVCVPGHHQGGEYPRHVLLNWCKQLENEMILIIDNVEDAVESRDHCFLSLLSDMRMRSDCKIKFLITSSSDIETVGMISNIPLLKLSFDPLDVEESIEVLRNAANLTSADTDPNTDAKLREIARLCENIPLALRLAGALLSEESEYTFAELKLKLEKNPTSTLGLNPVMEIAFEKLDESLQRALVSLSVFPQSFKRDAAEAILGDNCGEALTNLKKRCLIQKRDDLYLIHLLIRSYAKRIGEKSKFCQIIIDGKQSCHKHFLSLILRNTQKYWGKNTCKESFQLFSKERINIEYILREVADGQEKVQNCKELEDVVDACGQVAPYIEDCVTFKLYYEFLNGLLQFSRIQGNKTKQVELLFLLYDESRRHGGDMRKSKDLIDQAVKLYNENLHLFEQNRLSKASFLSHYGRYLSQDNDRRDEAERRLKQALSIVEKEGNEHASIFDIGRVLSQMGHIARPGKDKKGKRQKEAIERRNKEALTYFQKALRFRQTCYGEHVVTALAHKDMAGHYLAMEDFQKAKENYEAAVRIFEGIGMMKHKEAIPTYKNIARCYEKCGKIDQARRIFEMGSKVAESTIEGNDKWKVEINTNLALLLYRNYPNEERKAKELAKNVFSMAKELKMENWFNRKELKAFYQKG